MKRNTRWYLSAAAAGALLAGAALWAARTFPAAPAAVPGFFGLAGDVYKRQPQDCPYSAVSRRTKVPRMPLMNFTVSGVSYFLAISTASLMEAPWGMSGMRCV